MIPEMVRVNHQVEVLEEVQEEAEGIQVENLV